MLKNAVTLNIHLDYGNLIKSNLPLKAKDLIMIDIEPISCPLCIEVLSESIQYFKNIPALNFSLP